MSPTSSGRSRLLRLFRFLPSLKRIPTSHPFLFRFPASALLSQRLPPLQSVVLNSQSVPQVVGMHPRCIRRSGSGASYVSLRMGCRPRSRGAGGALVTGVRSAAETPDSAGHPRSAEPRRVRDQPLRVSAGITIGVFWSPVSHRYRKWSEATLLLLFPS